MVPGPLRERGQARRLVLCAEHEHAPVSPTRKRGASGQPGLTGQLS